MLLKTLEDKKILFTWEKQGEQKEHHGSAAEDLHLALETLTRRQSMCDHTRQERGAL